MIVYLFENEIVDIFVGIKNVGQILIYWEIQNNVNVNGNIFLCYFNIGEVL
jgi:hypothetical protein